MYDFHYNYIRQKYNDKAKLLFTDTESLCYGIQTGDAYADFWKAKELFDNADYPKESPYFDATYKKVIGKMKDEAAGMSIVEFVGLRSKMYSYVKDNGKNEKTAKGVRKYAIKKNITNENYKDTLMILKCCIQWKRSEVWIIRLLVMNWTRLVHPALMTSGTYMIMA